MRYTNTTEGMIPFKHNPNLDIWMPVKLERVKSSDGYRLAKKYSGKTGEEYPMPMRIDGHLVYALPGGGDYLEV